MQEGIGTAYYAIVQSFDGSKSWRFATQEFWTDITVAGKEMKKLKETPSNKDRAFEIMEVGIQMTALVST